MGLFGAFIAGIVVGWFLHYIFNQRERQVVQSPTDTSRPKLSMSEPTKSPAVKIEKLTPLPKEPQQAVVLPKAPSASTGSARAAESSVSASQNVISGGAASGAALANVTPAKAPVASDIPAASSTPAVEKPVASPAAAKPKSAPPKAAAAKIDRLQTINGIGPAYEKRLKAAGVQTFAQLAAQAPDKVVEIIAPQSWQTIDAAGWIAQAKTLAES